MLLKNPVQKKFQWTAHSESKMRQYGLSKQKILSILHKPERVEHGIAPGTVAAMKTNKIFFGLKKIDVKTAWKRPKKTPGEIWIMYRDVKNPQEQYRKIISAWRFPGISKPGEEIPIPPDIRMEIMKLSEK